MVIQRVSQAGVSIHNKIRGAIGKGLLVFLGIEDADGQEDIDWLANKIVHLRIFDDSNGVMNLSVKDVEGDILLISQFTLLAATRKGNRPSYIRASKPETAIPLYEAFLEKIRQELGREIATGEFGADMKVSLTNDGPVTIWVDSKNRE